MSNIKTYSSRSGSLTIDFDTRTVSYIRGGSLAETLNLHNMKINMSEITAIEKRAPSFLKLGCFNIIVNNIRYVNASGYDATQFSPSSTAEFSDLEGAMKQVLVIAKLSGFCKEGSANAKKELYIPKEEGVEYTLTNTSGSVLKVFKDHITLQHGGMLNALVMSGMKGEKRINFNSLIAIELKQATSLSPGYISFSLPGSDRHGGISSAQSDENSIVFNATLNELASKIVEYIEERRAAISNPSPQIIQQTSVADELLKFKQLLDMGVITQEEFNNKKKELLK